MDNSQQTPSETPKPKSKKWLVNVIGLILALLPIVNLLVFNPCNDETSKIFYGINNVLAYIAVAFFGLGLILAIYFVIKKQKGTLAMQLIIWSIILFVIAGGLSVSVFCYGGNKPV